MTVQSPVYLSSQLNFNGWKGDSSRKNRWVHVEAHIESEAISHSLVKPTRSV
jgi:hypothetical protein